MAKVVQEVLVFIALSIPSLLFWHLHLDLAHLLILLVNLFEVDFVIKVDQIELSLVENFKLEKIGRLYLEVTQRNR